MPASSNRESIDPPVRFPTGLDRFTGAFFCGVAVATVLFAVAMADADEGLVDGIVPSLVLIAFLLPQYYLMWRLYGHRRRQQIAERHERFQPGARGG